LLLLKSKLLLIILLSIIFAIFVATNFIIQVDDELPLINGVIIPNSKPMKKFVVLDHRNQQFSNQQLMGRWHLLTYGYTNCPDVCPTTLSILAKLMTRLKTNSEFKDLNILFYSIDHQRDTVERLEKYLSFFDDDFLGLTYREDMQISAIEFEKNFGMISILTPVTDVQESKVYGSYQVSHGFMLYLINPLGQLQAVFKPLKGKAGENYFDENTIYNDYVSIRKYFG